MNNIKDFISEYEAEFLKDKDEWENKFSTDSLCNYIESTVKPISEKYGLPCDLEIYEKTCICDFCPQDESKDYVTGFIINGISVNINITNGTIISFRPADVTQKYRLGDRIYG